MNALLIITIIALQDDGSITRRREMIVRPSMVECKAELKKRADDLSKKDHPAGMYMMDCEPMATLEVVRPAPTKEAPAPKDPARKAPIEIIPDASRTGS